MPPSPKPTVAVLAVLAVALATTACRREPRSQNPDTSPPPVSNSVDSAATPAAPSTTSTHDHAEVFRRAFWRHPTPADEILNAERRVHPDDSSWSWFIQLHPSPELLDALRDQDIFGLLPPGPVYPDPSGPSPSSAPPLPSSPPPWFPNAADLANFEIHQSPSTALTVLYRASDNLLFATDHGTTFSPPAK